MYVSDDFENNQNSTRISIAKYILIFKSWFLVMKEAKYDNYIQINSSLKGYTTVEGLFEFLISKSGIQYATGDSDISLLCKKIDSKMNEFWSASSSEDEALKSEFVDDFIKRVFLVSDGHPDYSTYNSGFDFNSIVMNIRCLKIMIKKSKYLYRKIYLNESIEENLEIKK